MMEERILKTSLVTFITDVTPPQPARLDKGSEANTASDRANTANLESRSVGGSPEG